MTTDPTRAATPAVTAQELNFSYNGNRVLTDLSFAIDEGSYTGIIGPNGGGKTTLLRIVLGLIEPKQGSVSVLGNEPRIARKGGAVGYVPQRATQFERHFPATVYEVVRSGMISSTSTFDSSAVENALEETGIADLRGKLIYELSGGQRQRVFIARCLIAKPKMLLLDEPVTGVDTPSRDRFYALLRKLNREQGMTILFVTHDVDAIAKEVDQVLCINQKICCHASPQDFLQKHVLDDLYGQSHV